jgi:hypothetical protein
MPYYWPKMTLCKRNITSISWNFLIFRLSYDSLKVRETLEVKLSAFEQQIVFLKKELSKKEELHNKVIESFEQRLKKLRDDLTKERKAKMVLQKPKKKPNSSFRNYQRN